MDGGGLLVLRWRFVCMGVSGFPASVVEGQAGVPSSCVTLKCRILAYISVQNMTTYALSSVTEREHPYRLPPNPNPPASAASPHHMSVH